METKQTKIGLYPGCSLEGTSAFFTHSLKLVLEDLGVNLNELNDWNCCGATSAHALSHDLYLSLNMRNLVLAEQQGYDEIIAPCAACYHRLASAAYEFEQDEALKQELSSQAELNYQGNVKVRNVLDFLANVVGPDNISQKVKKPLSGLKVACYYGCLNTRVPRMKPFDNIDYPMSMDKIITALGGEPIDWSYKTECCGASLFISSEETSAKLVSKILKNAIACQADCIAVSCPLCHSNLDTKQKAFREQFNISQPIPALFITQLMGLAFGYNQEEMKLNHCYVPFSLTV